MRCCHFFIVEIINRRVNLIPMSKIEQKTIITIMENNWVFIKTQSKKKDAFVIFALQERNELQFI